MNAQNLKNSILQLAIQGKLVEQRVEEETASDLCAKIKNEKDKLVNKGHIKKVKPLPNITDDEILFDIPASWKWVKFGDLVNYSIGKTPPRSEAKFWGNDTNWISIADMVPNGYINNTKEKISAAALQDSFKGVVSPKGTLLMSFKLTIGRVSILDIDAVHNEGIISIFPYGDLNNIMRDYFFNVLPILSTYGNSKGAIKGKTLNSTSISNLLIPLPPLEEQKRIVEKIEELIPHVEKYGVTHEKLEILNKNFPSEMKNSILQYAIQGKLVEQRIEEGLASNLYEQIQKEKSTLIAEGRIKKEKQLPEIIKNEVPFDIPNSWKWVKFGDLVNYSIGKTPPRSEAKFWGNDTNWISIADMVPNGYINNTKEKISATALQDSFKGVVSPKGTLLMSFKLTIGRVSILDIDAVHNEGIISIFPYGDLNNIMRDYFFNVLPILSTYGNSKGAIKGKTLNSTSISNLLIPLPPLEEQKRIVEKLEQLIPYLENTIKK